MPQIDYAALSFAIAPVGGEIQLMPAGMFRARDGRPAGLPGWTMDAPTAQKIIAHAALRRTPFVVDYEHQTLTSEKNGHPAPAAGWFKNLEWRGGSGLFATGVDWTAKAKAHIDAGEYKFISPVFAYDKKTGEVLRMEMAALTNTPALDGMDAVTALAQEFFNRPESGHSNEDQNMKALAILLGLADSASEADIATAVTALKTKTSEQETQIAALTTETAALKTHTPDPAKFVPVETVTQLQTQIATLSTRLNQSELDDVITAALSGGKLLPAMETWARDLGKSDLAALKTYIEKNPAIAALNGNQTGGRDPGGRADGDLSATDLAVCKSMGIKPEDYKATLGEQAAA